MKKILAIFLFLTLSTTSFSQQIWQQQMPDSITIGVYLAYTEGASNSIPANWIGVTSTDICAYNSGAGMELCEVAFVTRGPLPIPIEAQKYWSGYWYSFYDTIPALPQQHPFFIYMVLSPDSVYATLALVDSMMTPNKANWIGVDSTVGCSSSTACMYAKVYRGPSPRIVEAQYQDTSFFVTVPAIITTGIAETPIAKPKVFITGDQLQLESSGTFLAEVFDIHGRLLEKTIGLSKCFIDMNIYPTGVYIVRIEGKSNSFVKFVKY